MNNEEQVGGQEGQQQEQEQKQQPSAAGQGINNAFRLGRGLFKLGRFGLNKKRKATPQKPEEEAVKEAEAVVKKGLSFFLKRFSIFISGVSLFWFLVIISLLFFLFTIIFPSGGIIPSNAKALIPTPGPITNPGGNTNPGTGGGGISPAPTTNPGSNIRQALINNFGVTMNNFDDTHLQWMWELLSSTSNTKFPSLVRGATIVSLGSSGGSAQVGCRGGTSIEAQSYSGADFFKFIITHELGHFIRNCDSRDESHYSDHINAYSSDGPISYYAGHAAECSGSDNLSEDYADMIAYYLHPSAGFTSGYSGRPDTCGPDNPVNPYSTDSKGHYAVAQSVLQ